MIIKRTTIQKVKIMDYLRGVKSHPSAEMVYLEVKKEIPTITLATVYRNLNKMAENGEILKLEINNEFRFDGDISGHQHCVCDKCGKIFDVFDKDANKYLLRNFKSDDFTADNVSVIFRGICKKCGGK